MSCSQVSLQTSQWVSLREGPLVFTQSEGIYCIRNKINGKEYVGLSFNLAQRLRAHLRMQYSRKPLYRSMKLHGVDAFEVALLQINPWLTLQQLEAAHIKARASLAPRGYNCTEGGEGTLGYKHSEELKAEAALRSKLHHMEKTEEQKEESRNKQKERWTDPVFREKMVASFQDRPRHTEARRKQQGAISKQFWENNPEAFEAFKLAGRESWTPEKRTSRSERNSGGGNPKAREVVIFYEGSTCAKYIACAEDAAKMFNVSGETMRRWAKAGSTPKLPGIAFAYL